MHILVKNFGINQLIGASILASICFIVLLGNINKIAKINSIIIPILIAFILFVGVQNLKTTNINALQLTSFTNNGFMWIIQATLYASYNLILLIPVLINLKKFIKNKKQILIVSIISSVILSIISILVFFLLINVNASFDTLEMPAVYVIKNKFPKLAYFYGIIILVAIFTTATSIGASFLNNATKNKKQYNKYAFIMCIASIIVSNIRFSQLVKILFPTFGYAGILQILLILMM